MHNRQCGVIVWMVGLMALVTACQDISSASNGSSPEVEQSGSASKSARQPLTMLSRQSFQETLTALRDAVETRNFTIFTEIDHAAGAARIDANLRPTTLVIFGNPQGGTPLMQAQQTMGLDLPLKMLVYVTEDNKVMLAWADMADVFHRHMLTGRDTQQAKISGALSAIAKEAAGSE